MKHRSSSSIKSPALEQMSPSSSLQDPRTPLLLLQLLLLISQWASLASSAPQLESNFFSEQITIRRLPDDTNEISSSRSGRAPIANFARKLFHERNIPITENKSSSGRSRKQTQAEPMISGESSSAAAAAAAREHRQRRRQQQQSAIGDHSLADSMAKNHGEWDQFEILEQPTVEGKSVRVLMAAPRRAREREMARHLSNAARQDVRRADYEPWRAGSTTMTILCAQGQKKVHRLQKTG